MRRSARTTLIVLLVPLLAFVFVMQNHLDPLRHKYQPGKVTNIELGAQFVAATLIGLKEVVAGLLWVRTDEFFHTGNYAAVVPMVRIVTWLDPHQIDVYDTGAWHLAYNFTDSQERSDRRYIPTSKALYREGVDNNPNTYDLYFDLGWLNFNKILDYPEAAVWFHKANQKPWMDPVTGTVKMRPQFVGHSLAHALEHAGDEDQAIAQWEQNIRDNERYSEKYPREAGDRLMVTVAKNNLTRLLEEKAQREKLQPTVNAALEAHWQRIAPRQFRVWGTLNLPDGARVRLKLCDKSFHEEQFKKFSWDIDQNQTILVDDLFVRNGKFSRVIDIQRDAAIYPLKAQDYVMTFTLNPMNAPDFVQDKIGWLGNGLANQKYLVVRGRMRMLEKRFDLKRSDLL